MLSRLPGLRPPVRQGIPMPAVSPLRPETGSSADAVLRHDWRQDEVEALFDLPFPELLYRAATVHRRHFDPARVQVSTLLSIKTGGCPEDCAYCPQAQRYHTGVEATKLMTTEEVVAKARQAREAGASRFCMGAAWRSPKDRDIPKVAEMIRQVKALGLETCATLGMLSGEQARALREAGLDYYNHNLDTDPGYYGDIIHTRGFEDRLETLEHVRRAGLKTCCGGIVGMGETRAQRAGLLRALANLPAHPDSVPVNRLVQVEGTPLHGTAELDPFEFVRTIAVARILMPRSMVRLSAGREQMSDELQALCFLAGANSIFHGEKLLTTPNPDTAHDQALFDRLGLEAMPVAVDADGHDHGGTVHADIADGRGAADGAARTGTCAAGGRG
jgi:biotin synthase